MHRTGRWPSRSAFARLVRLLLDIAIRVPAEYLTELRRDFRHGLRMLAGSPGFTAVVLISLSLGIGIATCAYSEVNGLLRDLPGVRNPGELVALQSPVSYPTYKRYRELHDLFYDEQSDRKRRTALDPAPGSRKGRCLLTTPTPLSGSLQPRQGAVPRRGQRPEPAVI